MNTFKIYDNVEDCYLNSLSFEDANICVSMVNEEAFLSYDNQRYTIVYALNISDSNGQKLYSGDIIKVNNGYNEGLYEINIFNGILDITPVSDSHESLTMGDVTMDDITYVTSKNYMVKNNLKFISCNCPECLNEIIDIIPNDNKTYFCKECNKIFEIS